MTGAIVWTVPYGTRLTQTGAWTVADGLVPGREPRLDHGAVRGVRAEVALYVTARALNVRSSPNTAGTIIGTLTYGPTVSAYNFAYDANVTLWKAIDVAGTQWIAGQ